MFQVILPDGGMRHDTNMRFFAPALGVPDALRLWREFVLSYQFCVFGYQVPDIYHLSARGREQGVRELVEGYSIGLDERLSSCELYAHGYATWIVVFLFDCRTASPHWGTEWQYDDDASDR